MPAQVATEWVERRVLHVTSGLRQGGAETMLHRLIRSRHAPGRELHSVVSLTRGSAFDYEALGVPVEWIDLWGPVPVLSGLAALREVIGRRRPQVIQSWMYHGNAAATLARVRGIPVIWSIHHSLHDLSHEKVGVRGMIALGAPLSRWRNTRRIVYCSRRSREQHAALSYSDEKAVVIPNGLDCSEYRPEPSVRALTRGELGLGAGDLVVGNFGRYHPVKDHSLLLRAFAGVVKEEPRARLLLAGSGMDGGNASLARLIRELGLGQRVALLGPRSDMPRLYNALDAYVLSSKSEAFPIVLGEASACGVPAVTTDVGDASDIVGGTGAVVRPGSIGELQRAIVDVLRLDEGVRRERGEAARRRVEELFSLEKVSSAFGALYEWASKSAGSL